MTGTGYDAGMGSAPRNARARLAAAALLVVVGCGSEDPAPPGSPQAPGASGAPLVHRAETLLLDHPEWMTVVAERPEAPVEVGMAMLARSTRDSGPMPALRMTAPAEVVYELPQFEPGSLLRFGAGLTGDSHGAGKQLVDLTVELDGERVLERTLVASSGVPTREKTWQRKTLSLDGARRLVLRAELRTHDPELPPPVAVFGLLEVQRPVPLRRTVATPERPNVLLILIDTLRADGLHAYGNPREVSPHLDALAARGTLFERSYSPASWTWPSTASLMTGLPPPAHGIENEAGAFLSNELTSLAEVCQDGGLRTGAFSTNILITPGRNFDQGFEDFRTYEWAKTRDLLPDVEQWLRAAPDERFFLYLHLSDPHTPWTPLPEQRAAWVSEQPADWQEGGTWRRALARLKGEDHDLARIEALSEFDRELYDAEIAGADAALGDLFALLAELGVDDRTLICVTSDHGEEFFDHGMVHHTKQLFEESLHVPLILAGPGVPAGTRVATPVEMERAGTTLLRLAGLDTSEFAGDDLLGPLEPRPIYGATEMGWWFDEATGELRMRDASLYGVLDGDERLHWAVGTPEAPLDLTRLFRLDQDPEQLHDLSAEQSARTTELRERIAAWLESHRARSPRSFGADDEALEMLRGLGYMGGGEDE